MFVSSRSYICRLAKLCSLDYEAMFCLFLILVDAFLFY